MRVFKEWTCLKTKTPSRGMVKAGRALNNNNNSAVDSRPAESEEARSTLEGD